MSRNGGNDRSKVAEKPAIQIVEQPVRWETYCPHCHLATPTWRERCIHCAKPLVQSDKGRRLAA